MSSATESLWNLRWFRVTELEGRIQDRPVTEYLATVRISFDLE